MPELLTTDELYDRHNYAKQRYSTWRSWAAEVELAWNGQYQPGQLRENADVRIISSSEGYALQRRMEQMLAIRSKVRVKIMPFNDSDVEQQRVDKIERCTKGYLKKHRTARNHDVFRRAATFALLRGRGPIHTFYSPEGDAPYVLMNALDSYDTFPIYGMKGVDWWTSERRMTRQQLYHYYDALPADLQSVLRESGAIKEAERRTSLYEQVNIVEYWDGYQFAWGVNNQLAYAAPHGYPCVTYREIRLGDNGLNDERWNSMSLLGMVVNDLKMKTELQSKMALAVEAFFFPDLFYRNTEGGMTKIDPYMKPGKWVDTDPDFDPKIVNKDVNHQALHEMYTVFSANISKNTLPDKVFMPNASNATSGFHEALELGELKDAIADPRDAMQVTFGQTLGDVLKLHETFDTGEGYAYASAYGKRRTGMEVLTAADIAGHYDVDVKVHAALPGDMLQKITQFKTAVGRDPVTGQMLIPPSMAMELSELDDEVEDMTKFQSEIDWDYLVNNNEQVKAIDLQYKEAQFADKIAKMQKMIDTTQQRESRKALTRTSREIERGLSQDVVIPAEIAADPNALQQVMGMVGQGMPLQNAIDQFAQQGGLPLGVPGQPMGGGQQPPIPGQPPMTGSPETSELVKSMFGADAMVAPESPNGLTGYEGQNPMVNPPAMQGAQPRRVVDQPNVFLENVDELQRRGAKPAPK